MTKNHKHEEPASAEQSPGIAPDVAVVEPTVVEPVKLTVIVEATAEIEPQMLAQYVAAACMAFHRDMHPSSPLTSIHKVEASIGKDVTAESVEPGPSRYAPNVTV